MEAAQILNNLWIGGIGAIGAAGLFAVVLVLVGGFNEFTVKALVTTLVLGYYSLTAAATLGAGVISGFLTTAGVTVAGLGLLVTVPVIWTSRGFPGHGSFKAICSLASIAFGLALVCIDYRAGGSSQMAVMVMGASIGAVVVVTLMVLNLIISEMRHVGEGFYRVLIALTIVMTTLSGINALVGKMA